MRCSGQRRLAVTLWGVQVWQLVHDDYPDRCFVFEEVSWGGVGQDRVVTQASLGCVGGGEQTDSGRGVAEV